MQNSFVNKWGTKKYEEVCIVIPESQRSDVQNQNHLGKFFKKCRLTIQFPGLILRGSSAVFLRRDSECCVVLVPKCSFYVSFKLKLPNILDFFCHNQ